MQKLRDTLRRTDWLTWVGCLVVVMLAVAVGRQTARRYRIEQDRTKLDAQIETAASRNEELTQLLQYLKTPAYSEEQARLRFGMAKPGEKVAVVGESNVGSTAQEDSAMAQKSETSPESLKPRQSWWRLFFHHE